MIVCFILFCLFVENQMSSGAGIFVFPCCNKLEIRTLGKRQMDRLASMQNDTATTHSSVYGKKLLEKMGWSE